MLKIHVYVFVCRERVHLRELIGGTTSDLSNSEQSELCFKIFQLAKQITLRFVPKLMNLNPRYRIQKVKKNKKKG